MMLDMQSPAVPPAHVFQNFLECFTSSLLKIRGLSADMADTTMVSADNVCGVYGKFFCTKLPRLASMLSPRQSTICKYI